MGWSSASEIFDCVARSLLAARESTKATTTVLSDLIAVLRDADWDTEDESLELFADEPSVVNAFAENGIYPRGADDD